MKKNILLNQNHKHLKVIIIGFGLLLSAFSSKLFAQGGGVEWSVSDWKTQYYDGTSISQNQSGEDWWYGVKSYYTGAVQTGYVVCGYSEYNVSSVSTSPFYWQNYANNYTAPLCYNYIETLGTGGGGTDFADVNCLEFESVNNKKAGVSIGEMAVKDLKGVTLWEKTYNLGDLVNIIQVSDGFISVGSAQNVKSINTGNQIAYNPNGGAPIYFNCTNPNAGHAYVVKTDFSGNVIWEYLYGFATSDGTGNVSDPGYLNGSEGLGIILASSGHLIITGSASNVNSGTPNPCDIRGFVLDLDPNGLVLNKFLAPLFPIPASQNTNSLNPFLNEFLGITEIGTTGKFVVVGREFNIVSGTCAGNNLVFPASEYTKGIALCLNSNLTLNSGWSANSNPVFFTGTGTSSTVFYKKPNTRSSNIWNVSYHATNNQVLIPLISDCSNCSYTAAEGTCYLYRLDPATGLLKSGGTNPSLLGYSSAFDLRPDVKEDLNGGIMYSSTTIRPYPPLSPITSTDLGSYNACITGTPDYSEFYDSDAYIAKFDGNGVKLWEKIFDRQPTGSPRVPYPGDVKKKECIFKIDITSDGGCILAGTSSQNMEDDYLVKLYSDCNSQQAYDITGITNISPSVGYPVANLNSSHKIKGLLRVGPGGTLNITGAGTVLEFADSKLTGIACGIVVYPGGVVNINGATLTSISNVTCPGSMWDGITLIGNGSGHLQNIPNQPNINLTNATIKNARIGIANGTTTSNSGGWIIANNTTFLNNYIDVNFLDYAAPIVSGNELNNKSYFKGCTFIADNYLNDPSYVQNIPGITGLLRIPNTLHVGLSGVKGVRFIGNTFKTDLTTLGTSYYSNFRSTGIKSINSTFSVFSTCLAIDMYGNCSGYSTPNTFENLRYGIYAEATNPLKNLSVTTANFTNCFSSIYQSGVGYSTVNKNNFLINTTIPAVLGHFNCYAHPEACMSHFYYANNVSGFSHQENTYLVASSSLQKVMGTIFNGCGAASNESYHNTYTNCYIGHQSQLTNGANTGAINGLQIKCNQNTTTRQYDIIQTSGILGQQGECIGSNIFAPANNTFSHYQASPPSDVNGYSGGGFTYKYSGTPASGFQIPLYFSTPQIIVNNCGTNFNSSSCPSKLTLTGSSGCSGCTQITILQNNATTNRQTADQLSITLKQALIDGGSSSLLSAINSSMSDGNLKNLLLSKSPYLSDAILIAYIQRTNTPTTGNLKQIIIANSPVSSAVKNAVNNLGLPNGIQNQINAAQIGASAVMQKQQEIAYYNFQKDLAVNEIVRYYLQDTITPYVYDNIVKWLEWNNTKLGKVDLVFAKTAVGDFTRAQYLIDSLAIDTSNAQYIPYLQVNKDMAVSGLTWDSLLTNVATKTLLENIANDSLHPHMGHARAMLGHTFKDKSNYEFIEGLNSSSSRIGNHSNSQEASSIYDDKLVSVLTYPNPFNTNVSVSYVLDDTDSENSVEIKLIELASGKLISKQSSSKNTDIIQFNTENLANGVYIINISNHNVSISNTKIINIK